MRAVAVLAVVGYHAFPQWITGGFFGVDIFFVISGYLISGIIFNNLQRHTFSFTEFYIRRIRRIFPSLALMLVTAIVAGWMLLLPDEYKQLGKHIAGGAGFIANYQFWMESGYFDAASETKPMLHLWSLGIEEQFYIIWPLLLWAIWKKRRTLLVLIGLATLVSFVMNVDLVVHHAKAAFFSPPTRFWELSMGSLLAYARIGNFSKVTALVQMFQSLLLLRHLHHDTRNNLLAWAGLALLGISILLLTRNHALPGWWAMLPTLGAVLIISAGAHAWVNRTLLGNPVLVWFGLISFPLYLWHWPLLSFARILRLEELSTGLTLLLVAAAILFAWLTYVLVETPLRFGSYRNAKAALLSGLMIAIGITGFSIHQLGGISNRLSPDRAEFAAYFENSNPDEQYFARTHRSSNYRDECNFYDMERYRLGRATLVPRTEIDSSCYVRDPAKPHALMIWGDSHAQQYYIGLKHNLPSDWQILQVASSGCAPRLDNLHPSTEDQCTQSNWFALDTIVKARPQVVLVAQSVGHDPVEMGRIRERLISLGVTKVLFAGPVPHWTADLPKIILRRMWDDTPRRTFNGIEPRTLQENAALLKNFTPSPNALLLDMISLFCNAQGCLTYLGDDKMTGITTWDYGHLTEIASDFAAKTLLVPAITSR